MNHTYAIQQNPQQGQRAQGDTTQASSIADEDFACVKEVIDALGETGEPDCLFRARCVASDVGTLADNLAAFAHIYMAPLFSAGRFSDAYASVTGTVSASDEGDAPLDAHAFTTQIGRALGAGVTMRGIEGKSLHGFLSGTDINLRLLKRGIRTFSNVVLTPDETLGCEAQSSGPFLEDDDELWSVSKVVKVQHNGNEVHIARALEGFTHKGCESSLSASVLFTAVEVKLALVRMFTCMAPLTSVKVDLPAEFLPFAGMSEKGALPQLGTHDFHAAVVSLSREETPLRQLDTVDDCLVLVRSELSACSLALKAFGSAFGTEFCTELCTPKQAHVAHV